MAHLEIPAYPAWAAVTLDDAPYSEADIPVLKIKYGQSLIVLSREGGELRASLAPVEIIKFGILGRCVKPVPAATLVAEGVDLPDATAQDYWLVCTPPLSGEQTDILVDMAINETQYFAAHLRRVEVLDRSLAIDTEVGARAVESIVVDAVRRLNLEADTFRAANRTITMPTGYWSVYDSGTACTVDDDKLATMIRAFSARSLRARYPLPHLDPAETEAARDLCLALKAHASTEALASKLMHALCASPGFQRVLLTPPYREFLLRALPGSSCYPIDLLLGEELSDTAMRLRGARAVEHEPSPEETAEDVLARLKALQRTDRIPSFVYRKELHHNGTEEEKEIHSALAEYHRVAERHPRRGDDVAKALYRLEQLGVFPRAYTRASGTYYLWTTIPEEARAYLLLKDERSGNPSAEVNDVCRAVPSPAPGAVPWVFDMDQILVFGAPNGPLSAEDAFARLDYYVGGYLGDLDLRRTLLTGSAIAAALIRAERAHRTLQLYALAPEVLRHYHAETKNPTLKDWNRFKYLEWLDSSPAGRTAHYRAYVDSLYPAVYTDPTDLSRYRGFASAETNPTLDGELQYSVVGEQLLVSVTGRESVRFDVRAGADVDMAIDVATDEAFDAEARAHFEVIRRKHPGVTLTRIDRANGTYSWSVRGGGIPRFRAVEMYRATFDHVVTHHVGMVSGAYTARFHEKPTFVVSARLIHSMTYLSSPNYYYFASRKCLPQEIILKYAARGFDLCGFPRGISLAIASMAKRSQRWCCGVGGHPLAFPAYYGTGNFSVFSLLTERSIERCRAMLGWW